MGGDGSQGNLMNSSDSMIEVGMARPVGATWTGTGVNFAVFSAHAERIELCLFGEDGRELERMDLPGRSGDLWHGFVPAPRAAPGTRYGFRAHGPWAPAAGHRFDPAKLLIDPAAKALAGEVGLHPAVFTRAPTGEDSAPWVPRSVVIDTDFDWGNSRAPGIPWRDTLLCELHVKGYTQRHPDVPPAWRGKYLGLTVPAVIAQLKGLGITTVELLPCQAFGDEPFLLEKGLRNYWGYNPLAWFAPSARYAVEDPVREFRQMVRALHDAGLEVVLDMVFNHTAEGGEGGLTLGFKGLDNASYYRLRNHDRAHYADVTGCGNTVNATHPMVRELILDCLRYWAAQMRVDGFRFDLAPALARDAGGFEPRSPLFAAIEADPVLSYTKLIAEPWDLGPGGYQLGRFPAGWAEWNDRYRDTVRAFWRGDRGMVPALAERLAGSSDLFRHEGRRPSASINFITAHDGFTLADLVSYTERRNEANLEVNRDGHAHNLSWNYGVEGPTDDPAIRQLRLRQMANMLSTLLLSQGTPMLLAADLLAHSQQGNNNAYCQDGDISWLAWPGGAEANQLQDLIRRLVTLRRERPELRRDSFFKGSPLAGGAHDVCWLHPEGRAMGHADWWDAGLRCLGMLLGDLAPGERVAGRELLLIFCADERPVRFVLPGGPDVAWQVLLDTALPGFVRDGEFTARGESELAGRSLQVLERSNP